jgi:hypothetical protein
MSEILAALGGATAALLVVALVSLLRRRTRGRADLEAMLDAAHRESDDLRARLEELAPEPATAQTSAAATVADATYVITDAGLRPAEDVEPIQVPDRLVLSATLGAPLVKIVAFSHGVRRALSAQSRNRIRFEMRQEVRSARKRRRQQVRAYERQARTDARAPENHAREGLA